MTLTELLPRFAKLKALVAGDICLDRWCMYDPATAEPSRETGIARLGVVSTEVTPGAGGTVANNLAALGTGKVTVLGAWGDDGFGFELDRALAERQISTDLAVKIPNWQTFTYTKLLNAKTGIEDQPRVDFISTRALPGAAEQRVIRNLLSAIEDYDVILVSDQAETEAGGVITPAVRNCLTGLAAKYPGKLFLVDSRKRVHLFQDVMLKPNRDEAETASSRLFGMVDFERLRRHLRAKVMFVTDGPNGTLVIEEGRQARVAARMVEDPVDICGAGDSFAAGTALALAITGDAVAAAEFGNLVASITIMKRGTGTASPQEIMAAAG